MIIVLIFGLTALLIVGCGGEATKENGDTTTPAESTEGEVGDKVFTLEELA